jgi:hypothetical protein
MGVSVWQLLVLVLVVTIVAALVFRAARMRKRDGDDGDD